MKSIERMQTAPARRLTASPPQESKTNPVSSEAALAAAPALPPEPALVPGTFYRAEITESHDYDIVARIIE